MRIAFGLRADARRKPGGDALKAQTYAALLRNRGHTVDFIHNPDELGSVRPDLLHLFNIDLPLENSFFVAAARRLGVPFTISTIHHPEVAVRAYYSQSSMNVFSSAFRSVGVDFYQSQLLRERLRMLASGAPIRAVLRTHSRYTALQREILVKASQALPMTIGEEQSLREDIGDAKFRPIPNAFTFRRSDDGHDRDGVLSVGRIEPRKNQLQLIRALADTSVSVTIVGQPNRNHPEYVRAIERAIKRTKNVRWIPGLPRTSLRELYQRARLHASLSWFEVVSQVDLEAISNACPVVVSRFGHIRDYIDGRLVEYDPTATYGDLDLTRELLMGAYELAAPVSVKPEMLCSWDDVVDRLCDTYTDVLAR